MDRSAGGYVRMVDIITIIIIIIAITIITSTTIYSLGGLAATIFG